jgi:hypothetical protein
LGSCARRRAMNSPPKSSLTRDELPLAKGSRSDGRESSSAAINHRRRRRLLACAKSPPRRCGGTSAHATSKRPRAPTRRDCFCCRGGSGVAVALPRAQQSRRARRNDCIARAMRKPDRTKLPAVAALLLSSDLRLLVRHGLSRLAASWRTAASARRCASRVARGWPYPPRYCFSAASAPTSGPGAIVLP